MSRMVKRKEYLDELLLWKDKQVIKVITGIRRCGKSTLLKQFQDLLLEKGIDPSQIISINFEELEAEDLLDYKKLYAYIKKLYAYIKERIKENHKTCIFLDEIQNVLSYEKVINSLYGKDNIDLYITGSNSCLLSGNQVTRLTALPPN